MYSGCVHQNNLAFGPRDNAENFETRGLWFVRDGSDLFAGSATFNNSGTLSKTTGTGTDNFNIALNNSGTVSAQNGTLRFVVGGTSAGAFSASAGATVEFASNWSFTNGTHFSGAGTIQLDNNTTTNLSGTITNSGTILVNSTGNFTDLRIADGTTLTGGGSVVLSDSPFNRIYGTANSGTETLTNVNNTISGAGQIGVSNSIEFINQSAGVINATSATNALIITPTTNSTLVSANGGGFVNQGLLEATAAGGLVLNGGQFNNQSERYYLVGLNLAYHFNPHFSAEMGYNYDKLDSDAGRTFDRNRVYMGVTASY